MEILFILGLLLIFGAFKYKPRKFGFKPRSVDSVQHLQGEDCDLESRRNLNIRRRRTSGRFAKSGSRGSMRMAILAFLLFAVFVLVYTLKLI